MDENFYIVLPSNSKVGNTPSDFITNFKTPFSITNPSEWEVGLKEIHFKNTIKTIDKDIAKVYTIIDHTKVDITNQALSIPNVETITYDSIFPWVSVKDKKTRLEKWKAVDLANNPIKIADQFQITISDTGHCTIENLSSFTITIKIPQTLAICLGFITDLNLNVMEHDATKFYEIENLKSGDHVVASNLAMISISHPDKIFLFPEKFSCVYSIKFQSYESIELIKTLHLKSGTYVEPKELETELNKDTKVSEYFTFSYDQRLNRFDITTTTTDTNATLHLENGLHDVLGFTEKVIKFSKTIQKGDMEVNLMRGITSLFIYCDIVQPIHVGTIMAPLLRTVSFNVKQYGEMIHVNYMNPIYLNLNKSYFHKITVQIYDAVGVLIPFVEGLTTIVLHFRRKN